MNFSADMGMFFTTYPVCSGVAAAVVAGAKKTGHLDPPGEGQGDWKCYTYI